MSSSRSHRASISPFRSRKSSPAGPPPAKPALPQRPVTPSSAASSSSLRPPSRLSSSPATPRSQGPSRSPSGDSNKSKENVTVTVRFRPLSAREIGKGDEVAWYADGEYTVRNEYNTSIAYGFDRVFGPATTTRNVYDVAAQHVISGAMQGINGTVFAYGVTSSGKTHTMHGEQKSPGIIPLAVKDVFGIIQETPGREFLLRVSYLEIYNEVINDLLDPTGQNLRIREDAQGTYVEGIKDEVVLSPAHALSLIASGEAHRHVGSNNFNLLSSRSHTIFTLTIESSPRDGNEDEEDVTLSQLNLIDLAGSESSKTETTGLRRKEGSYINKSLLTLGTVISKLTDDKATHVPYRDSKLTRLLQSSLSGHGRISLICTLTPASSNSEETHNTLKFAHRSKNVEIKASQNKIMDEKSLIKRYQKEISCLKTELQLLKHGMIENPYTAVSTQEDLVNLKLQLEAGQVKLQSRLEEEEEAKAALMGRIQRLTKLILVSTKNSMHASVLERPGLQRRHSFGEDELAYLPDRKRDYAIEEDAGSYASELSLEGRDDVTNLDEVVRDYRRSKRRGMLGWFKMRKPDNLPGSSPNTDNRSSASGSPASSSNSSQKIAMLGDMKDRQRNSISRKVDEALAINSFPERTQAGDLISATVGGRRLPPSGTTVTDQMDLLSEQVKVLAGDVALCSSSLKRLSEKAASNPEDYQLKEQMKNLKDEIREKKLQMRVLEQRMIGSVECGSHISDGTEISLALSKLTSLLNEKTFELEIKSADNRILQEQLQMKMAENTEMKETVLLLRQQLSSVSEKKSVKQTPGAESESTRNGTFPGESPRRDLGQDGIWPCEETYADESTPKSVMSLTRIITREDAKDSDNITELNSQTSEIENLRQEKVKLIEEKDGLEIQCQKLAEEASYAKELASAAAVELRNLAEEVTKLSYENAKLIGERAAKERFASHDSRQSNLNSARLDWRSNTSGDSLLVEDLRKELNARYQREAVLEAALSERDKSEDELHGRLEEAKRHEVDLENELANMWVLVSKMRKCGVNPESMPSEVVHSSNSIIPGRRNDFSLSSGYSSRLGEGKICEHGEELTAFEELQDTYQKERTRCKELENLVCTLKGDDVAHLDVKSLEELQNFHIEAITKICQAKRSNQGS